MIVYAFYSNASKLNFLASYNKSKITQHTFHLLLYMKVLSIDIGIKNFAFCLFEKGSGNDFFYISKWDVVNISEEESFKCSFIVKFTQKIV